MSSQPAPVVGKEDVLPAALKRLDTMNLPAARSVAAALVVRAVAGEKKYGTKLQSFNGRDALVDAYEEAQDAYMYLTQRKLEDPKDIHIPELLYLAEDLAMGLAYHIERKEKARA